VFFSLSKIIEFQLSIHQFIAVWDCSTATDRLEHVFTNHTGDFEWGHRSCTA